MHDTNVTGPRWPNRRRTLLGLVSASTLPLSSPLVFGQDRFPNRPVRFVVPFPAGGAVDVLARAVGEKLGRTWPYPVVVDNRPGGNQIIGTQNVAQSAADGYSLLLATTGHAINVSLIPKLPYDPLRDFRAVAMAATAPNVLVCHPSLPVDSLPQLLALMKSQPDSLNAGHPGTGTTLHLSLELLKSRTGTRFAVISYKGTAPSLNAVLGNEVDFMFDVSASIPHVRSGKLKALAVTGPKRLAKLPDVPTVAEAGLPDLEVFSWYAFLAPTSLPAALRDQLNRDITEALKDPSLSERLQTFGLEAAPTMTPSDVDAFIVKEAQRWAKVVKDAGIAVEN